MPLPHPFPPDAAALVMAPADLAGPLLAFLAADVDAPRFHRPNVLRQLNENTSIDVARACAEAFAWLERECLIVHPVEANDPGVFSLSRSGKLAASAEGFAEYRQASLLPPEMLHPTIRKKAWSLFLTGNYDTAVFAAFKAVEVAVERKSGSEGKGVSLMRTAFHKDHGPLRDDNDEPAEREGLMHLFGGAFAIARNPAGHRDVSYDGPGEAAELLVIASHLMRVVDGRTRVVENR